MEWICDVLAAGPAEVSCPDKAPLLSFTTGDKKLNAAEAMSTAEVRAATGLTYRPASNYFFCKGSLDIDNDPFFFH